MSKNSDDPVNLNHVAAKVLSEMDEIGRLRAENVRLMKTLAFYADPETYFAWGFFPDSPCGKFGTDFSDTGTVLGVKPGKRARAALAQKETKP